jgi:hypothetical protein
LSAGQTAEPQRGRGVVPLSCGAGLLLATLLVASPLGVCAITLTPILFTLAGRGLPPDERKVLFSILGLAIAARVALVVAMFLAAIPNLNDLSIGGLAGDESYNLARAIRTRDIMLGFAGGRYDYFVAADEYGRTFYVWLLAWIQVAFGPTPYSMRLVNGLMFMTGAVLLFREARRAFGSTAALAGLAVLLFIPSLLVSSISLLKESFFFLATCVAIVAVARATRTWRPRDLVLGAVAVAASVWVLNDLRRGAAVLTLAGLGLGLALRAMVSSRWRMIAAAALVAVSIMVVVFQPAVKSRVNEAVLFAATTHAGHVFTVGHAYKLMDEGFYMYPGIGRNWQITMTDAQALRFVLRAMVSFVVTPLPWQMASRSELAFLPEHLLWYLLLALLPAGLAAGGKRDPILTSILIGYCIPTAAAIALTNGNVGTLLRMRGLVSPYLLWLSVLGLLTMAESLLRKTRESARPLDARLAVEGHGL